MGITDWLTGKTPEDKMTDLERREKERAYGKKVRAHFASLPEKRAAKAAEEAKARKAAATAAALVAKAKEEEKRIAAAKKARLALLKKMRDKARAEQILEEALKKQKADKDVEHQ